MKSATLAARRLRRKQDPAACSQLDVRASMQLATGAAPPPQLKRAQEQIRAHWWARLPSAPSQACAGRRGVLDVIT